jgi:hypothetical protein
MALKQKLEKLKKLSEQNKQPDWDAYKEIWKNSISELQNTIMYKWFQDYEENGLMIFSIVPVKRIEPYIGEYLTTTLEITLTNNKFLILEPVSAVSSEYDGKLDFYMSGNVYKRVSILRKIINDQKNEWIIARSFDQKDHYKLDKEQLEKIIEEWLQ